MATSFLFEWRKSVASDEGPSSPTTRHVLLTLSLHMDGNGAKCYPGIRRLSSETRLHRKTVEKHLRAGELEGWIEADPEWQSGQRKDRWRATLPGESGSAGLPVAEEEAGAEDSRSGAKRERRTPGQGLEPEKAGVLSPESGSRESTTGSPGLHVGRRRASEEDGTTTATNTGASGDPSDGEDSDPYVGKLPPPSMLLQVGGGRYVYPPAFEETWAAYPSRFGGNPKAAAYAAFRARAMNGADPETLLTAAQHYADYADEQGQVGTEYVKQAATFFGPGEAWKDFREPMVRQGNGTGRSRVGRGIGSNQPKHVVE